MKSSKEIKTSPHYNPCSVLIDLLFPINCLSCGTEGDWLCKDCFKKLEFNTGQYCLECKLPTAYGEYCPACRKDFTLDGVWIAGDYDDPLLSVLIKHLKYKFIQDISPIIGRFLSLGLRNLLSLDFIRQKKHPTADIQKQSQFPNLFKDLPLLSVMPVPLSKRRLNWRGFNQSKKIGRFTADSLDLAFDSDDLIRTKHKKPQASLNERERKTNMHGCFTWTGGDLSGRNIILIDDVITTGATLNECAKILKTAGAERVWGLVAAKG